MSSVVDREAWQARLAAAARENHLPATSTKLVWSGGAVLLIAVGALLWHLTRGTTFWFDEWVWVTGRRASTAATFLNPYNGHFSLVPVALYKLLFATAGLHHYGAYRAMITVGHLVCVVLLFLYARTRVGDLLALLAAALLAFLGPGWQDILWPFQIAWLVVVAAAIGALLLLDRRDRLGDVGAAGLLMAALASQTIGLALVAGVAVEIAAVRRRWRDAWIVVVPLVVYGAWWLGYQDAHSHGSIGTTVNWVAESAAASLSALTGLSGVKVQAGTESLFTFGAPLAVAGLALIGWLWHSGRVRSPRVLTIAAMVLAFWIVTGLGRSDITGPTPSRYLYLDAALVLLLVVELARGARVGLLGHGLLALGALAAVVANLAVMRDAAAYLRGMAQTTESEIAAINLSRPIARPGALATSFPGYPFIFVAPGEIYAAEAELGQTGDTLSQLAGAPAPDRAVADQELVHLRALAPQPAVAQPPATAGALAPVADLVAGGSASARQGCVAFRAGVTPAGATSTLDLRLLTNRVSIAATNGPTTVGVRRFGDQPVPIGTIPSDTAATLSIPADGVPRPWHLQLLTPGRLTVCGE